MAPSDITLPFNLRVQGARQLLATEFIAACAVYACSTGLFDAKKLKARSFSFQGPAR
jgi:hypothetical protein